MTNTKTSNMLSRRLSRLALAFMLVAFAGWAMLSNNSLNFVSPTAQAANLVVTNTSDSGAGSLRQAILDANNNGSVVVDTITFNIPGGGVKTITPASPLPNITTPTLIDGYTQPGASVNTLEVSDNAMLLIELNGANAGASTDGLYIEAPGCTIKGLVINRFGQGGFRSGIVVTSSDVKIEGNFLGTNAGGTAALSNDIGISFGGNLVVTNCTLGGLSRSARNIVSGNARYGVNLVGSNVTDNTVQGNYIGTDVTGTMALGIQSHGVLAQVSSRITIGGTTAGARNVISGNTQFGIAFTNGGGSHIVQGNYIGTQANGTGALGSAGSGGLAIVSSSGNTIGGTLSGAGNVIASNGFKGVYVAGDSATGNAILSNSIFLNGLGIDLGGNGLSANDVGDGDAGANNLQNFPVLSGATLNGGTLTVAGTLNSTPNKSFRIEYFLNPGCHDSGYGEGQTFVGAKTIQTDASGNASVAASFHTSASGQVVTATATDDANNTSEFSPCIGISGLAPGTLQLNQANYAQYERLTTATITVIRTNGSSGTVTVHYATSNGTAIEPDDYIGTSGTLTFANGETSKSFTFTTTDDAINEPDKTVNLTLSNPTGGATLGNPFATTLTIEDDDPTISISDVSKQEGDSAITSFNFNVTLSEVGSQTVTVNYATSAGGTATSGNDYQPASGTLSFTTGQTSKTVTVLVNGDPQNETDETFLVQLSNPTNATLAKAQGTGTIINDDSVAAPTVQFNSSSYSISEDLTSAVITVTRSGDSSGTATVDYATSNGSASQKGDYEIASGTLTFAPGDVNKTFVVLINEDSYVEGPETVNLTLSSNIGAGLGGQSTAVLTILDDATESFTNPNDDAQNFVYQQYHDFLNREPDAGGLAYWTSQITQCGNDQNCANEKRRGVSAAFFIEMEFQETGYFVYRIHSASFGMQPTYQQFMADRGRVKAGAQLEQSKQALADVFVQRTAFKSAYPDAMPADQFVNKLYDTAGLMGYATERAQATQDLMTNTKTRAQVLRDVMETPEFKTREYNPSFVLMQYFGYLRRNADQAGYQFWLNVMNSQLPQDQSGYRAMVCAFITSAEYQDRFSAVHAHSNPECGP